MAIPQREIRHRAKRLVLSEGPSNILEFGYEYIEYMVGLSGDDREALIAEMRRQAIRVYHFLGYEPPFRSHKGATR